MISKKVIIPGLHGSGEDHWQTHLENEMPDQFIRIQQENWHQPDCRTWIQKIEHELVNERHSELILIGHSIGCMAIVKWFEQYGRRIKGALLVAPSDPEDENYPAYITGFKPVPKVKLPFPSVVVASSNDHVTPMSRSMQFADDWGSELIVLESAGHIEPQSGFGRWPLGFELIKRLDV